MKSLSKFIGDNAIASINGFAMPGSEYVMRIIGHINDGDYLTDYVVQVRPHDKDGETLFFKVDIRSNYVQPCDIQGNKLKE